MRMYSARRFFAQPLLVCPDCAEPMRLLSIAPVPTEQRADEIAYRCDACRQERKQITRPVGD
jgi:hypothetical protein